MAKRRLRKRTSLPFLALGLGLLVYLLSKVGLRAVLDQLALIGWGVVPLLSISFVWKSINVLAWSLTFPPDEARPGFWSLFRVSLAGDVVNNLLPSANLGGEMAKPYLLRSQIPMRVTFSTVIAHKTVELLAGLIMVSVGAGVAFLRLPLDRPTRLATVAALAAGAALLALFSTAQRKRPISRLVVLLERLGLRRLSLDAKREAAAGVDDSLITLYGENRPRLFACLGLRITSQVLGVFETYLILRLMGIEVSLSTALIIFALPVIVNAALFFMPGGIGTSEATHTYLGHLLNLGSAAGLSVALIKRFRRWFWVAIGALLLSPDIRRAILRGDREEARENSTG